MIMKEEFEFRFCAYELENLSDIFYHYKEKYKLLGILDNSKIEKLCSIIIKNIKFHDKDEEYSDSEDDIDDNLDNIESSGT